MTSESTSEGQGGSDARMGMTATELLIALGDSFPGEKITIGELLDGLTDRAFGFLMLFLALFCAIPFLYGVPQIVSVPMILLSAQIVIGRHTPWMPASVRARSFSRETFKDMARRAKKYVGWVESIARPRFTWLTRGPAERIFGVAMLICSLSIAVPLPLTNTTPGIAVAVMSIGFIQRDGLLVIAGTILGLAWVAFLVTAAILMAFYGFNLIAELKALL